MDVYVFSKELERIALIDSYSSLIMCQRYQDTGDFELYISAAKKNVEYLKIGNYIMKCKGESVAYMIESVELITNAEDGNYITVKGRCLKSILDRRIIWEQTNLYGTAEDCIRQLIDENAIQTKDKDRAIPYLQLQNRVGFSEHLTMQVTGNNLLEKIIELCKMFEFGFDIKLIDNNMIFELFQGENRSHSQERNHYVVFSQDFGNLIDSQYNFNSTSYKNVALVAGEGEGTARKMKQVGLETGIDRKEIFVDSRDVSTNDGEITEEDYTIMLEQQGQEALAQAENEEQYTANIELSGTYQYNRDFKIGDIVTTITEYGMKKDVRIMEFTENWAENGEYTTEVKLEGVS